MEIYTKTFFFLFYSILLMKSVYSTEMSMSLFDRSETTCKQLYGTPLPNSIQYLYIHCAYICGQNPLCLSFMYSEVTKECIPNSNILVSTNASCSFIEEMIYSEKVNTCGGPGQPTCLSQTTTTMLQTTTPVLSTTSGTAYGAQVWNYMTYPYFYMSDPCLVPDDCLHIANTECRVGICQCMNGFTFDWVSGSCVTSCATYGHSYQIENDVTFAGPVSDQAIGLSEYECLDFCTNSTTFVCRTVTYDISAMECKVSSDAPPTYTVDFSLLFNVYQRDCLFP